VNERVSHFIKKFPSYDRTQNFIAMFTNTRNSPQPDKLILCLSIFILLLFSSLHRGVPSVSHCVTFPLLSSPLLSSPQCYMPLLILVLITKVTLGAKQTSHSPSLCDILYFPVTSIFLGQNVFLAPYSQTPSVPVPFSV
jgi:hypothetical protein